MEVGKKDPSEIQGQIHSKRSGEKNPPEVIYRMHIVLQQSLLCTINGSFVQWQIRGTEDSPSFSREVLNSSGNPWRGPKTWVFAAQWASLHCVLACHQHNGIAIKCRCRVSIDSHYIQRLFLPAHDNHENSASKSLSVIGKGKVFPYSLRALGPELIPVYRQSAPRWREVNHAIYLAVVCHCFLPGLRLPS